MYSAWTKTHWHIDYEISTMWEIKSRTSHQTTSRRFRSSEQVKRLRMLQAIRYDLQFTDTRYVAVGRVAQWV
jgi:hypothetical protein